MPKALRAAVPVARDEAERRRVAEQVRHARDGRDPLLLPIDQIDPNPANPRRDFSEAALDPLAESIKTWGQLQPVVVRRVGERYELVCGERRWRAHRRAGLPTIWAVERDASEHDALALALIENLQRVDLSHAEKVAALDQLAEVARVAGLRQTARQLRVDPSWLSRQLAVRRDPVIFPALEDGRLNFGQAAELLRAPAHARRSLLDRALREKKPSPTIRFWVEEARTLERRARATIGATLAAPPADESPDGQSTSPYRALLAQLEVLGRPRSTDDRAALGELVTRARQLLDEPNGPAADALHP